MPEGNRPGPRIAGSTGLIIGLIIAATALPGCGQQQAFVAAPIKIASAYVMQTNGLDSEIGYLVIANSGSADTLVSVRSSAGGQVMIVGPRSVAPSPSGPSAASPSAASPSAASPSAASPSVAKPSAGGSLASVVFSQLSVPGHTVTRLDPSGVHLEFIHSKPLREGTDVTLTLVFAHAGTVRVLAQVNNPATNNGGYFGP